MDSIEKNFLDCLGMTMEWLFLEKQHAMQPGILYRDGMVIRFEYMKKLNEINQFKLFAFVQCEKYLEKDNNPFLFPRTYDDPEDLKVENWRSFLNDRPLQVNVQVKFVSIKKVDSRKTTKCKSYEFINFSVFDQQGDGRQEQKRSNLLFKMPTLK